MHVSFFLLFVLINGAVTNRREPTTDDEEDWFFHPKEEFLSVYRIQKETDPASGTEREVQHTGWVNARLGYCVGERKRLLWWFGAEIYIISTEKCTETKEAAGNRLFLAGETRLKCVVRQENPHTTITFGKRSTKFVQQRLLDCDKEWTPHGTRQVIQIAMERLPPDQELQREQLHQKWLQDFRASAPSLNNVWRAQTCASLELFQGIPLGGIPKLGFEFDFSTAFFENCDWGYDTVLAHTQHIQSGKSLISWTAEEACKLELRTIARPVQDLTERPLIIASVLASYLAWSNMLGYNVPFTQIVDGVKGALDSSPNLPPEITPLLRKKLDAEMFTIVTKQEESLDLSNIKLRQTGISTTGMSAQMNIGLPFLIYDPVCLEIWQREGILIENDNPLHRLSSRPDFIERVKQYGEPYIRAMLGYMLELFLTELSEAEIELEIPINFKNYYMVLPKVNWQEKHDEDPLRFKKFPEAYDYNLYREGLKVFKREFAPEVINAGIEIGNNGWHDLTARFRSPKVSDFFRRQQDVVRRHTFPPFMHNGHVYIVCEFRGTKFGGLMSGKLNLLMIRGTSDASQFSSIEGGAFLFPDLVKLDRILNRVQTLQMTQFDSNCQPILHPEKAGPSGVAPLEIQAPQTRVSVKLAEPFEDLHLFAFVAVLLGSVTIGNLCFREASPLKDPLIDQEL